MATALLADAERPVAHVGGGARRSPGGVEAVRGLGDDLDAPVAVPYKGRASSRGRSPIPGRHGVTLPPAGRRVLDRADVVLALGTCFDGITTADWSLPMGDRLIHVTLDPESVDVAYEADDAAVPDLDHLAFERLAERTFALAGGVTRPLRMDGHGKSLSFVVLGIGLDP
ncbi:hypothetical protein [Halorarum salinum]|uniref:Thiamine pyrophosphate enzyme central domain-containing protein n=1 Tax=Halorarum salinum TaxID=2743089 RepID=A0A7D5QGV5_9EURY|nr:hypothetical protein [Halobaculum salinum]QLG61764.1 hypothetical protein HUG12_08490 [Halobaculum salinum]